MINLLTNSISNSFDKRFCISIGLTYNKRQQQIQVTVEDHGIGIPEEDQQQIFNFLKGNAEKPSIGLGLAVSKKLVSEYNGSLSFISVDKRGSSFSFTMDLEEAESIPVFAVRQESDEQIDSS